MRKIFTLITFLFALSAPSFAQTNVRHELIGQISDKISNIIAVMSFSARKPIT